MDSYTSPTTKPLYRGTQVVWYIIGFVELALALRFALKLLGANAGATFTDLVYSITGVLVAPFALVFRSTPVVGNTLEWTTLLAMFIYLCIALGVINLFLIGKTVSTPEAAANLNKQAK